MNESSVAGNGPSLIAVISMSPIFMRAPGSVWIAGSSPATTFQSVPRPYRMRRIVGGRMHAVLLRIVAALCLGLPGLARAEPIADFYRGKTVTFLTVFAPGGTYDLYGRL